MQAFARRAAAIYHADKAGEPIPECNLVDAINSYKESYRLKENFEVLIEAFLIAIEQGMHDYYV